MSGGGEEPDRGPGGKAAGGGAEDERTRLAVTGSDASHPADSAESSGAAEAGDEPAALVGPGVLINDNYRILGLVSAGGMGEVYRAENIFTGDPVAVKIILPGLARDRSVIELFRREARILVQMRDNAIVRYHNFVRDRGLDRYCLIMEFVEGRHLWDHIRQDGPLKADDALLLMRRLARGLAEAHARGVTHRDLSPDNVILRENRIEEAVLIDFGIARSTEFGDGLGGRFAGKFKYIAPEQLGHGRGEIGPAADVYGLALMIAAAMRGRALEMGDTVVAASQARRAIPDLSGISYRLYPLLQHMLEPDPLARPRDMDALLRILDDPAYLPARYRLPLWTEPGQGADGGDPAGGTGGPFAAPEPSAAAAPDPLESASPFGPAEVPEMAPEPAGGDRPKGRRWPLWLGAALVVALAVGGWVLRGPGLSALPGEEAGLADVAGAPAAGDAVPSALPSSALPPLPLRNLETRDGFLASLPLPPCSYAGRIAAGPNSGMIGGLADGPRDFAGLVDAYARRFDSRPALISERVTPAQCAALDFMRELAGRPAAPPVLSLERDAVVSGDRVTGRIGGLGGRSLWLFLVSSRGGVHDLSSGAVALADGSFAFDFAVALAGDESGSQPQLVIALASAAPLAEVAAAPPGAAVDALLPRVMAEIRANGGDAALDLALLRVSHAETGRTPADESLGPSPVPAEAP